MTSLNHVLKYCFFFCKTFTFFSLKKGFSTSVSVFNFFLNNWLMEGNWVRKAFSSRWSELTYLWIDQFEASTNLPSNPLSNIPGHLNFWRVFCSNTPPGGGTFYTWPSFKTLTLQTFSSKTFAHQRELFFLNTSPLNVIICILLERLDTSGSNSPSPRSRMTVECPWVS